MLHPFGAHHACAQTLAAVCSSQYQTVVPVESLAPGTHRLSISCDRHASCAAQLRTTVLFRKPEAAPEHQGAQLAKRAYSMAEPCISITAAEQDHLKVQVITVNVQLQLSSNSPGLSLGTLVSYADTLQIYVLLAMFVVAAAAARRLSKVIRSWLNGMDLMHATGETYSSHT